MTVLATRHEQAALGADEVHLWIHRDDERSPLNLSALSSDELARAMRMGDPRRARRFLLARALCRSVLSRYIPVAPGEWRFALGDRGRPEIIEPSLRTGLWFNLSHVDGLVVCAVTAAGPSVGLDVESVARGGELDVARHFFDDAELRKLGRLSARRRAEHFAVLWTLKESLAKARGCSLATVLDGSSFTVSRRGTVRASFTDAALGDADDWRFALVRLDRARVAAVALGHPGPSRLRVYERTWPGG